MYEVGGCIRGSPARGPAAGVVPDADRAYGPRYSPALHVAAGRRGVDTVQGDSGDPLFAPAGGAYRRIGFTSFGIGCATARYPGVYTELSSPSIGSFVRQAQTR